MKPVTARDASVPALRRGKTASLDDVAALAGVSAGTVSRVLSRPDMISEATRKRVLEAVDRLDHPAARNGGARDGQAGGGAPRSHPVFELLP